MHNVIELKNKSQHNIYIKEDEEKMMYFNACCEDTEKI